MDQKSLSATNSANSSPGGKSIGSIEVDIQTADTEEGATANVVATAGEQKTGSEQKMVRRSSASVVVTGNEQKMVR